MSHVASQKTEPGMPMYQDVACMQQAAEMLGGELVHKKTYTWWGRSVGDYPLPEGVKAEDLGKNAEWVFRLSETTRAALSKKHGQAPYEIGFVVDPNNPGCFIPMLDEFLGGYGLLDVVGRSTEDGIMCPRFKQYYDMCCDAAAAREVGDSIEIMNLKQAHERYPDHFQKTTDVQTWVSIADTKQRIGV